MIQNLFVQVLHLSEICSRQPPPTCPAIAGVSHVSHSTEKYRMERKKQPIESVLSKILLIFASTLVKTGGKLRRATTLLTVSESANSTVKVLEELGAALSISYIYAPASRRGRHAYMPYRCGLFFILTFTGIAEPTGEE